MLDLNSSAEGANGRGRRTLGLTGLRSAQRWNPDESRSGGHGLGRGHLYVGKSSSAGARRGAQFAGYSSDNRAAGDGNGARGDGNRAGGYGNGAGGDGNAAHGDGNGAGGDGNRAGGDELVPFPLFDDVFIFTSPSMAARGHGAARRGAAGRGRGAGAAGRGRGAAAAGRGRGAADDHELEDEHQQGGADGAGTVLVHAHC